MHDHREAGGDALKTTDSARRLEAEHRIMESLDDQGKRDRREQKNDADKKCRAKKAKKKAV